MKGKWLCSLALLVTSCEIKMSGDQTRFDDLTQRIMKLEKKNEESEANFKVIGQFANTTNQRLDKIEGKKLEEQKP